MKQSNALIVANGTKLATKKLETLAKQADFIIAADGGANILAKTKIVPDIVLGDLDSITKTTRKKFANKLLHIKKQDNPDLEKALDYAVKKGYKNIFIACASGDRPDFNFCNYLMSLCYINTVNIIFEEKDWRVFPISKSGIFTCKKGAIVSIAALGTPIISLEGLKYKLTNHKMRNCEIGISNFAIKNEFSITFTGGKLLVFVESK